MSGPPENIPPNALFEALCALPRPFRVVDIPRKSPAGDNPVQTHMQVLTQQERMVAVAEAEKFAQRALRSTKQNEESFMPKTGTSSQGYEDLYQNELSTQLLWRACRRVEDPKWPLFPTADVMRKTLTGDEIGVLAATYHIVQSELGPIVTTMSEDEVDAWIAMLERGASSVPLGLLSLGALTDLATHLVSRLSKYSTATGLSGEAAESGSTPSESKSLPHGGDEFHDAPEGDDLSEQGES